MDDPVPAFSRLTVDIPDYLHRRLKAHAAFRKTHIRVLVSRILYEAMQTIEKQLALAEMEPEEWDPGF